jgi:hypothetical protein
MPRSDCSEIAVLSYLIPCYFGVRHFGFLFGMISKNAWRGSRCIAGRLHLRSLRKLQQDAAVLSLCLRSALIGFVVVDNFLTFLKQKTESYMVTSSSSNKPGAFEGKTMRAVDNLHASLWWRKNADERGNAYQVPIEVARPAYGVRRDPDTNFSVKSSSRRAGLRFSLFNYSRCRIVCGCGRVEICGGAFCNHNRTWSIGHGI